MSCLSYQINVPVSSGMLPWFIITIICLMIANCWPRYEHSLFMYDAYYQIGLISSQCLPEMHSALLVKWKMHVSLQIHKMFRIRKMIMNPECILYKSCKLFNADGRLKRFGFLYLLGMVFVWWQKSHGQKVAAAKCKMHGTEKRGKFSILMATANLYSLT